MSDTSSLSNVNETIPCLPQTDIAPPGNKGRSNAEGDQGYAGVTVWIGDKSITRTVSIEQFGTLYSDPLTAEFADANAELRAARWRDGRSTR